MKQITVALPLLKWMLRGLPAPEALFPLPIDVLGDGPISNEGLVAYLKQIDCAVGCDVEPEVIVVGRSNVDMERLRALLWSDDGPPRVYSQELLLAYILIGRDPFEMQEPILREIGEGHPVLEELSQVGFDWPTTTVTRITHVGFDARMQESGFLGHLGYKVGKAGDSERTRRQKLTLAMSGTVPTSEFHGDYVEQWGSANSARRLQKIAESIAAFARNAKRKNDPPHQAIADWEDDLSWLREMYYVGRFSFLWPNTQL